MPKGLTNAPTTFQRFMNDIFADMIDINVIVYLDDILIYSNDISEHKEHVREVLKQLRTNGLFARTDKCEFHVTSCEYLRYMLSPEGLTMAPFKCWQHYLEGSGIPIDIVTDHQNLQYFSTTKILMCRQACWSEYLSGFNLIIHFRPA